MLGNLGSATVFVQTFSVFGRHRLKKFSSDHRVPFDTVPGDFDSLKL